MTGCIIFYDVDRERSQDEVYLILNGRGGPVDGMGSTEGVKGTKRRPSRRGHDGTDTSYERKPNDQRTDSSSCAENDDMGFVVVETRIRTGKRKTKAIVMLVDKRKSRSGWVDYHGGSIEVGNRFGNGNQGFRLDEDGRRKTTDVGPAGVALGKDKSTDGRREVRAGASAGRGTSWTQQHRFRQR